MDSDRCPFWSPNRLVLKLWKTKALSATICELSCLSTSIHTRCIELKPFEPCRIALPHPRRNNLSDYLTFMRLYYSYDNCDDSCVSSKVKNDIVIVRYVFNLSHRLLLARPSGVSLQYIPQDHRHRSASRIPSPLNSQLASNILLLVHQDITLQSPSAEASQFN